MKLNDWIVIILIIILIVYLGMKYIGGCEGFNECTSKVANISDDWCNPLSKGREYPDHCDCSGSSGPTPSQSPTPSQAPTPSKAPTPSQSPGNDVVRCCYNNHTHDECKNIEFDYTKADGTGKCSNNPNRKCTENANCTQSDGGDGGDGGDGECTTGTTPIVDSPSKVFQIDKDIADKDSFVKGCFVSQDCNNYCQATGPSACEMCGVNDKMGITCGSVGIMNRDNTTTGPDHPDMLTEKNIHEYMKYSCPLPHLARVKMNDGTYKSIQDINPNYKYNKKTNFQNWCSGANMHFDLTNNPKGPNGIDLGDHTVDSTLNSNNNNSNGHYWLKYRPVSCRDWGWNANRQAGNPEGSTDMQGCPNPGGRTPDWLKNQIDTYNPKNGSKKWQGIATWSIVGADPNFCGGSIVYPKDKVKNGKLTSTDGREGYAQQAAIPYTNICKTYGKTQDDVENGKTGTKYGYKQNYGSKDSICWEMEAVPQNKIELKNLKWQQGGLCTGNNCKDLNDIQHDKAPLIIAQAATACGGNCRGIPKPCKKDGQQKYQITNAYFPPIEPSQQEAIDNCMQRGRPGGPAASGCYSKPTLAKEEELSSTHPFYVMNGEEMVALIGKELDENKFKGGWLMPQNGAQITKLEAIGGNLGCIGFFQPYGLRFPPSFVPPVKTRTNQPNYYITLGGASIEACGGKEHGYGGPNGNVLPSINLLFKDYLAGGWSGKCGYNNSNSACTPNGDCGFGLGKNFQGVDFDIEDGLLEMCYHNGRPDFNPLIQYCKLIKQKSPDIQIQWTISGNGSSNPEECQVAPGQKKPNGDFNINIPITDFKRHVLKSSKLPFDSLVLMLYGGSMGTCDGAGDACAIHGDWGLPSYYWKDDEEIKNTIELFKTNDQEENPFTNTLAYLWDWYQVAKEYNFVNKMILGMSARYCTRGMVKLYIRLCREFGFKGILVWTYSGTGSGAGTYYCGSNWDQLDTSRKCHNADDCHKDEGCYQETINVDNDGNGDKCPEGYVCSEDWTCPGYDSSILCDSGSKPCCPISGVGPTNAPSPTAPTPISKDCPKKCTLGSGQCYFTTNKQCYPDYNSTKCTQYGGLWCPNLK